MSRLLDALPEDSPLKGEHVTFYTRFLFGTVFAYLMSFTIFEVPFIPEPVLNIAAVIFVVFWLGMPIALRRDKRYVAEHADWNPSTAYYLGFLPGYLGLGIVGYYLYKRNEKFEEYEPDTAKEDEKEEGNSVPDHSFDIERDN